jgi:hypothetical protein
MPDFAASATGLGRSGEQEERMHKDAQCRTFAWHGNKRSSVAAKVRNAAGGFAGEHIQGLRMDFRLCERMKACWTGMLEMSEQ